MRRFAVVVAASCVASACAMIAGLDDPTDSAPTDADASDDRSPSNPTNDAASDDGGSMTDADAGRTCTGTILKVDSFDDRTTDAAAGWTTSYAEGGTIDISDGGLHVVIPPTTTGMNARRQLEVTKNAPRRMCATLSVHVMKPRDTTAFFDPGNTVYAFFAARGTVNDAGVTFFQGIGIDSRGPYAYVTRAGEGGTESVLSVPINDEWRVYLNADFVANTLTIAVNEKEATFVDVRPTNPLTSATFDFGIRNLGQVPEGEAYFDDVVVTAD